MRLCGIDYGNKLAGTTVVAWLDTDAQSVQLLSSQKGKDADEFILQTLTEIQPDYAFIDAPLSLPGVYSNKADCTDYFFRKADKQLQAMSPMFLGGLTARAVKLKKELEAQQIQVYETYPAAHAARLGLVDIGYKKQILHLPAVLLIISQHLTPFFTDDSRVITNWHQIDALLALMGGIRFINKAHTLFGNEEEGLIIV
jgi:predicted nuclease with RNAse H fold